MLDLSPDKLAMVALVALVVLGPNRLPQAARGLGRLVANLRSMTATFHEEVSGALDSTGLNMSDLAELRPAAIRRNVVGAVTGLLEPGATTNPAATANPAGTANPTGTANPAANPAATAPANPANASQPAIWGATPDDPSLN